ncbi:DNA mismatch repair protein MutS [Aminobacter sp. MSH1]|uniref:MutS-related protein n=1 Tax=Aminobacter sp. MSH1 TaxID=374606 RepID=UPI000D3ACDA1|nr:DNA mismatch repair protein MutS [Aminobacter sp. MSH1]AWC25219.1 DNA mismatch repair protein MutS [Aminobacter sp. MSH1]
MSFFSILHPGSADGLPHYLAREPDYFRDLNLDQIVATLTAGRDAYDLKPFFQTPLDALDAIAYRQEVMRDVARRSTGDLVRAFGARMVRMRETATLAAKLHYRYQKARWFADAVEIYCEATQDLCDGLAADRPASRGLNALLGYLQSITASPPFRSLVKEARLLKAGLAAVRYDLLIRDASIAVRRRGPEADYTEDVEETFQRFRVGDVSAQAFKLPDYAEMNHIEAGILDRVALLYPKMFHELLAYAERNADYADARILAFDREIQFYLAYVDQMERMAVAGLPFCYPEVLSDSKSVRCEETFDLALAIKLVGENQPIVGNDFHLDGAERIFVVSGPNQGGKTTFARAFGQLHFLASLGCPVPGKAAQVFLFDRIFTHFEREESIHDLRGKLQDDLVRMHDILRDATPRSVVIMNEIFTSTALRDAIILGRKVLRKIIDLDALCVCVTFIDELATLGQKTVSAASTVVPRDPASRTYKIVRKPPDGRAYAVAIAQKYHLTYVDIRERLAS